MGRELPIFTPPGTRPRSRRARAADDRHGRRLIHGAGGGRLATPLRRHPEWIKARLPQWRQLPRAEGHAARPDAQHGLRGGPLPEHRGVLGAAHGHDHDPRRHLHPRLWLLRRQDRPPDVERRGRAASRGRGHPGHAPRARRRDQRRPRRPAGRRRTHLRRDHPRPAPRVPGHGRRGAHPGLQRDRRAAANGHGGRAGHPEPQRGDGRAAPEAGPQARPLPPIAGRAGPRQGDLARDHRPRRHRPHEVEPDGRPWGDARGAVAGLHRPARRRLRHPDHRPVPAPDRGSICPSSATCTPTSSRR